jgi:hypothetical protein
MTDRDRTNPLEIQIVFRDPDGQKTEGLFFGFPDNRLANGMTTHGTRTTASSSCANHYMRAKATGYRQPCGRWTASSAGRRQSAS